MSTSLTASAILAALLILTPAGPGQAAEPGGRDALVARITRLQFGAAMRPENHPALAAGLQFVRKSNPGMSDAQWKDIMDEVGEAMTAFMSRPGNPVFVAQSGMLAAMSDAELARLDALLQDPVYRKYSSALASASAQQALMRGVIENTPWMPELLNAALRKRGLKEVH